MPPTSLISGADGPPPSWQEVRAWLLGAARSDRVAELDSWMTRFPGGPEAESWCRIDRIESLTPDHRQRYWRHLAAHAERVMGSEEERVTAVVALARESHEMPSSLILRNALTALVVRWGPLTPVLCKLVVGPVSVSSRTTVRLLLHQDSDPNARLASSGDSCVRWAVANGWMEEQSDWEAWSLRSNWLERSENGENLLHAALKRPLFSYASADSVLGHAAFVVQKGGMGLWGSPDSLGVWPWDRVRAAQAALRMHRARAGSDGLLFLPESEPSVRLDVWKEAEVFHAAARLNEAIGPVIERGRQRF